MSVPESERYRNSTMFVGSPPFGYEGTDDRTSNDDSTWHPPRAPPHNMVYREHLCPHPGPCPEKYLGRRQPSRAKSPSPEADIPDMDLVDVVPALYSSPKLINPLLAAERRGHFPDVGRLSMLDNGQSRAPHNRGFNPLADHGMGEAEAEAEDVEYLGLLPELMTDDEHGAGGIVQRASSSSTPKSSTGGESPHMHDFLRCPECQHVLKWVFVEHTTAKGEHHVHRCQAICTCETSSQGEEWAQSARKMEGYSAEKMVQVNRGAW